MRVGTTRGGVGSTDPARRRCGSERPAEEWDQPTQPDDDAGRNDPLRSGIDRRSLLSDRDDPLRSGINRLSVVVGPLWHNRMYVRIDSVRSIIARGDRSF
jgi:hypothetical protein